MNRTLLTFLGAGLVCAGFQLAAQEITDPPPVLRIFREDIKEGRGPAHEKTEARFAQALGHAKYPANSLAMTSLTGPSQAWFLEGHASFASIGQAEAFMAHMTEFANLDSLDAESRAASRSSIAVYHPEMSYRANDLIGSLPKARYFNVLTFHVRSGRDQEFVDLARNAVAALVKSNAAQPAVCYQVVSGATIGTYLLLEPTADLKTLDDAPAQSRAFAQAVGGEVGMTRFMKTVADVVTSEESVLFTINPKMSYVSKEFAAGDPDFWTPKPAKAALPAKPAAKTSAAK